MEENYQTLLRMKENQLIKAFEKNQMSCMIVKDENELKQYLRTVLKDQKKVAVGAVRAVLVLRGRRLLPVICDVFGVEWALCGRRNKIAGRAVYLSEQPAGYAALPVCETRGCCTILLPAMRAGRPQHGLFVFNVGR